ncbi:MAG: hypothetical protein ACLUJR_12400 [Mediterraneibacter gnavus]
MSESSDGFFDFQWKSEYNTDENFKNVDYAFLSYEKEDDYIREHIKRIQSFGAKIVTATLLEKMEV